jgi:hypothetical protein
LQQATAAPEAREGDAQQRHEQPATVRSCVREGKDWQRSGFQEAVLLIGICFLDRARFRPEGDIYYLRHAPPQDSLCHFIAPKVDTVVEDVLSRA